MKRLKVTLFGLGLLACAAALALSLSSPAYATSQQGDAPQVTVRIADLNLQTDAGIKVLYNRLKNASISVCPGYWSRELSQSTRARQCVQTAMERAVGQLDNSRLTAVYMARR